MNSAVNNSVLILLAIVILAFSAFFSGMEIAFVSSSKLKFEMDRGRKGFTSYIIDIFYRHSSNFISTLLVGNNIALVIYGIVMAQLLDNWFLQELTSSEGLRLGLQTIISTLIVLVTGEFLPKTLFRINPNKMMHIFALPTLIIYVLLWPVSKFTSGLGKLLLRMVGQKVVKASSDHPFTKVDLDYLIQNNIDNIESEEKLEDEVKIFQNALDFSSIKVRDCIVPRTELDAVEENTALHVLQNQFVESGHSKIVVFREDIDDIVGYIHSSELFRLKPGDNWKDCIREIPIVPETMNAQKLLSIFMTQKKSMAVVVDEFGGTSGIVTLEDLVEEIFGDIEDEHDNTNYTAKEVENGEYLLSARLEIEKANEILNLDLPVSDEYLTVGGLILHEYQSFPKLNEVVRFGRWEFKIVENTTTKIELVRLKVIE